jgi:hypothetical protein
MLLDNNLRRMSQKHCDLASGLKKVRLTQLNKGNRTQIDPPVIPTGRRLKTSGLLAFLRSIFKGLHALAQSQTLRRAMSLPTQARIGLGAFSAFGNPTRVFSASSAESR